MDVLFGEYLEVLSQSNRSGFETLPQNLKAPAWIRLNPTVVVLKRMHHADAASRLQRSQSNRSGFETVILSLWIAVALRLNPTVVVLKQHLLEKFDITSTASQSNRSGFETSSPCSQPAPR